MEAFLPFNRQDRKKFISSALEIGFDEFVALKFNFTTQDANLDVFQLMGEERLQLLIYGWEICHRYIEKTALESKITTPDDLLVVVRSLMHASLDIWFSKEWDSSRLEMQCSLIYCLKRAQKIFEKMPGFGILDWNYLLKFDRRPWSVPYLKRFFEGIENNRRVQQISKDSSEHVEEGISEDDINYFQEEGVCVILLRLIKLFDAGMMTAIKKLSMCTIAAWNHVYEQKKEQQDLAFPQVIKEHKRCLIFICHIYLMAVYESDDISGFAIDNLMNNIRFYYQSIQETVAMEDYILEDSECTPARYIAMTCINLQITSNEFYEAFIFATFDENFTSLFGTLSQAYNSYLLGNLIMELNGLNEQNFTAKLEHFKRLLNLYVEERERSELFMLSEFHRIDSQRTCHNTPVTIGQITDFKSHICKGNRMSNIGNYENTDEAVIKDEPDIKREDDEHEKNDIRTDPIFQNIPNTANILNYVYDVLAGRKYKGWHFAKVVLLLKIIGHELNVIETWRYHPGLTTEFMLTLEKQLSRHFEDLAIIFQNHHFMEQEFWLTAFYLNPTRKYYEAIMRCGMRSNRSNRRLVTGGGNDENVRPEHNDNFDKNLTNAINAKFGLLSSTIDVQEIVGMTNQETPDTVYDPLYKALRSFRLPESIIKDLLTVTFLPRNRSFAWAVNWPELRKRCKILMKNAEQKRRFVELNMAEANDRLKYLKINYDKYKHRPQLDYGSIEQGYEGVMNFVGDNESIDFDDEDDDEDENFDEVWDYKLDEEKNENDDRRRRKKEEKEKFESVSEYFAGTRRTRSRTAAVLATAMLKEKEELQQAEDQTTNYDKSETTTSPAPHIPPPVLSPSTAEAQNMETTTQQDDDKTEKSSTSTTITKFNLKELLEESSRFVNNTTNGFKPFADIWQVNAKELNNLEKTSTALFESEGLLEKFSKLTFSKVVQKTLKVNTERTQQYKRRKRSLDKNAHSTQSTETKRKATGNIEIASGRKDDALEDNTKTYTHDQIAEIDGTKSSHCSETAINDEKVINPELQNIQEVVTGSLMETDEQNQLNEKDITNQEYTETNDKRIDSFEDDNEQLRKKSKTINDNDTKSGETEIVAKTNEQAEENNKKSNEAIQLTSSLIEVAKENNKKTVLLEDENKRHIVTSTKSSEGDAEVENPSNIVKAIHADTREELIEQPKASTIEESDQSQTDENSQSSIKFLDDEDKELINACTKRLVQVTLHRLTVDEVNQLRQPHVRVERMNMEKYFEQCNEAKRLRLMERTFYMDSDESSKSSSDTLYSVHSQTTPAFKVTTARARARRGTYKRRQYSSETSSSSEEFKFKHMPKFAIRGGRANTAQRGARGARGGKNLIVTPRSASGLKFRISSSATQSAMEIATTSAASVMDFIQISSSSSSDSFDAEMPTYQNTVQEPDMNMDPLYEEEVVDVNTF